MGDICNDVLLVVFATGEFLCHICQGGSEITDLVIAFHIDLVAQVAGGILLCGINDAAQRNIHQFREEDQDDQGKQKEDDEHDIVDIQQVICRILQMCHIIVYHHITAHGIAESDRRCHGKMFGFE